MYVVVAYLIAFFSEAPAVNFGTREAAIWIRSPVAGLRPSRALRLATLNLPKPEKETSLPRRSVLSTVSKNASTASAASRLLSPARSATWSTNSDFVTCFSSVRGLGLLEANTASGRTCKCYRGAITAFCEDLRVPEGPISTATAGRAVGAAARIGAVNLARIVWLAVVLVCVVTVLILLLQGYYGYAGVTFAVAVAAATNLT